VQENDGLFLAIAVALSSVASPLIRSRRGAIKIVLIDWLIAYHVHTRRLLTIQQSHTRRLPCKLQWYVPSRPIPGHRLTIPSRPTTPVEWGVGAGRERWRSTEATRVGKRRTLLRRGAVMIASVVGVDRARRKYTAIHAVAELQNNDAEGSIL